ncbi:MAG: hypothetical protein H5U05_02510 [Candidatus Aminicenantes bacterium]|nr:hypothetical protein [Candidatus Aminicenantes bacterium]HAR35303.1 hypothetical protein [Acidobacteriota bacterium]
MELIILQDARKELSLRARSGHPVQGYLLGRQTGPGLFVEKIFCLSWGELLKPEVFFLVEKNQSRDILGVFSLRARPPVEKRLLQPLFCGKVFLRLEVRANGEIRPRAKQIEFDRQFYFKPLGRIITEMEAADG